MQAPDQSLLKGLPLDLGNSSDLEHAVSVRLCFQYSSDRNAMHAALVLR